MTSEPIALRPEVRAFAEAMEMRPRKHDSDWGDNWKTATTDALLTDISRKLYRLSRVVHSGSPGEILMCAASVGAHAMFVADVLGALSTPPIEGAPNGEDH